MIIIFLDIDGVLLLFKHRHHDNSLQDLINAFDQEALAHLDNLITSFEQKGQKVGIVISSDWRQGHSITTLKEQFKQYAFSNKIVGKTSDKNDNKSIDTMRGLRIKNWLTSHKKWDISNFVILDDNNFDLAFWFQFQFVRCADGVLSSADAELAAYILDQPPDLPPLLDNLTCVNLEAITAAQEGNFPEVQKILAANPEKILNRAQDCCQTLVQWADEQKNEETKALLKEELVKSDIYFAAQIGRLDAVQALLEQNEALLNQPDNSNHGLTPLIMAAWQGQLAVVLYLLKQPNIDLNATCRKITALHLAIKAGHPEVAMALINAGAKIDVPVGEVAYQPIHFAARYGWLEVLQALLNENPNLLNQADARGQTPLLWAASKGKLPIVLYLLQQKNIELNAVTGKSLEHNDKTALYWAIEHGHIEIAIALIKAGINIDTQVGSMKRQPIHLAAQKGQIDVLGTLLGLYPQLLEQKDAGGQTPLIWAAAYGQLETVRYLVNQGANLYAATQTDDETCVEHNQNALAWAVANDHGEVALLLMEAGAIVNSPIRAVLKQKQAIVTAWLPFFSKREPMKWDKNVSENQEELSSKSSFSL